MGAFKHAALRIDDFRTHLALLQYVRLNDPKRYEADGLAAQHAGAGEALRLWLLSVRRAIDEELAKLPEPPAPAALPEKAAGYVSESLHG